MEFSDFIGQGKVKKGQGDKHLAASIIKMSEQDLKFIDSIPVNSLSARKLVCNYYDVLRSVIEAISALDGFKVYSHEAYTYYLRELKNEERLSYQFDRLRKIRNGLEYYGMGISAEEAASNIKEIKSMVKALKEKYL